MTNDDKEMFQKLLTIVTVIETFIDENNIYCSEAIYQTDKVSENSLELIEKLCEQVGYKEEDDQ